MTLTSEQMSKPVSLCLLSSTPPCVIQPYTCLCKARGQEASQSEGPERVRKRLVRLLDGDMARLEEGKSAAQLLKRGKLFARWAKAARDIDPAGYTASTSALPEPVTPQSQDRVAAVPLGVEAFRTALARELTLIRNKKENSP
jgi:hypothetical protein